MMIRRAVGAAAGLAARGARHMSHGVAINYSSEFGSAPVPNDVTDATARLYEKEHRIANGELGLAWKRNALQASAKVAVSATPMDGVEVLPFIAGNHDASNAPVFHSLTCEVPKPVFPVPTSRFGKDSLVVAVGHHETEGVSLISPGVVKAEDEREEFFETTCAPLGPGSFFLDMKKPSRLVGVVLKDGEVMSCKHPLFVINWVSHVLPTLVDDSAGFPRFPAPIMQYINDVKRTITKNDDHVTSMKLCEKIFIKNSIDNFSQFML